MVGGVKSIERLNRLVGVSREGEHVGNLVWRYRLLRSSGKGEEV